MKFFQSAAYALMASQLTAAAPVAEPSTDIIEYRTVNEAHAVLVSLDKRLRCQTLKQTLRTIGTSGVVVAFITFGGDLAEVVCQLANGQNCDLWAKAIRLAFSLVYAAAAQSQGAVPEGLPQKRDVDHDAVVSWWEQSLAGSGISFDSIEAEPFDASDATLSRRDGDPRLLARVRFTGLLDAETGHKHEIVANHFEGNNTVLHLPGSSQESVIAGAGGSAGLAKRYDGAGFKVSYTTRVQSKLTYSHQQEMAGFLANSWSIHSRTESMDDFIGFAKTDHHANFYYRVIPELRGFGLNYESVDVCGGMAGFL